MRVGGLRLGAFEEEGTCPGVSAVLSMTHVSRGTRRDENSMRTKGESLQKTIFFLMNASCRARYLTAELIDSQFRERFPILLAVPNTTR
jgi:hypothetical protein